MSHIFIRHAMILVFLVLCGGWLWQCGHSSKSSYDSSAVVAERKEKDAFFGEHYQSPLDEQDRKEFKGLRYYAPKAEYVVSAVVERFVATDTLNIKTTQATNVRMIRWGMVRFMWKNQPYTLVALKPMRGDDTPTNPMLHIYFTDATNDDITYEGGRYLYAPYRTDMQTGDSAVIDFNRAFNPYCAYNAAFVCPLVLPENHLPLRIEAGEQRFKK